MSIESPFTVHELLSLCDRRWPKATLQGVGDAHWTISEVIEQGEAVASTLRDQHRARNALVLVETDDDLSVCSLLHGTSLSGNILVVLPRGSGHKFPTAKAGFSMAGLPFSVSLIASTADEHGSLPWVGSDVIDEDLCLGFLTSGTTGSPILIRGSHRAVLNATEGIARRLDLGSEDVILSTIPLHFDYGFYQVLVALSRGASLIQCERAAVLRSLLGHAKLSKPTVVALNPYLIRQLAAYSSLRDIGPFPSVRAITSTGSAFPVDAMLRLADVFPNAGVYSMYGLTECKRVCVGTPKDFESAPRSVGYPMDNVRVAVDPESSEIMVQSGSMMEFEAAPGSRPELLDSEGRSRTLATGDRGEFDSDGRLVVGGRGDDLLKIADHRVSRVTYETIAESCQGVRAAAALARQCSDGLRVDIWIEVANPASGDEVSRVRDAVAAWAVHPGLEVREVRTLAQLPRLPNDKIDYAALRRLADGEG